MTDQDRAGAGQNRLSGTVWARRVGAVWWQNMSWYPGPLGPGWVTCGHQTPTVARATSLNGINSSWCRRPVSGWLLGPDTAHRGPVGHGITVSDALRRPLRHGLRCWTRSGRPRPTVPPVVYSWPYTSVQPAVHLLYIPPYRPPYRPNRSRHRPYTNGCATRRTDLRPYTVRTDLTLLIKLAVIAA